MISKLIYVIVALTLTGSISFCAKLEIRNGNAYLFSTPEKMTWHSAMRYCRNHSMHLVDVPSEAENKIIIQLIKDVEEYYKITCQSMGYWTSGCDLAETGYFYWATNGRSFNFTYWESGQPSNWDGQEHCVQYWNTYNFKWNDENCNSKLYAICKNHTNFGQFEHEEKLLNKTVGFRYENIKI